MNKMGKIIKILTHPRRVLHRIICIYRSWVLTKRYVDKGKGKIVIQRPFLKVKITKAKGSILELNDNLRICSWLNGNTPVNILLSTNAKLILNGGFVIGHGVSIMVSNNAELIIGGKQYESDSGITCNTLVMVYKSVTIGKDFICAWDVTITDSDWHTIIGTEHYKPIIIGDHVWVANKSCVLKGSDIGNNCIIAACSKVTNKKYPDNVLIAGTEGKVIKEGISWKRDI
jgi:acetyltransferase-like isoleucine patch superfamily enzyme